LSVAGIATAACSTSLGWSSAIRSRYRDCGQGGSVAAAGLLHLEQVVQPGEHVGVPVLEALQQALEAVDQLVELRVGGAGPI
jgi:hypothetical protein